MNEKTEPLYGVVAFEEPGMPWTKVFGRYRLIQKEVVDGFGTEPHWLIEVNGEETYVPESSVVVLNEEKQKEEPHSVPDWISREVKGTWEAMQGVGQLEAYRIMERMVKRLGYGDFRDPSLAGD